MKALTLSCFWLTACALIPEAIRAQEQLSPAHPFLTGGGTEPSTCLDGTSIVMTANPSVVQLGQPSDLSWHVTPGKDCNGVRITLNGQVVGSSGGRVVTPSGNSTFTVHVIMGSAETSGSAQVQVVFPSRVVINESSIDPVRMLLGALNSSNPVQTVELCNVDLDLTGYSQITIGANRSLIASPSCARGPRQLGPRIFVTDKRNASGGLFVIRDSNVRFSGFRLEGPTSGIGSDDANLETGIQIFPFDEPGLIHNIEVSNMEMSHWSGAAIRVSDNTATLERGRLTNESVNAVHVQNNYLHHNRHIDGDGYGVSVADGGYALIEQNVFEENRHAIAGISSDGKKDYSGYTARDNLILPGGGLNCNFLTCWQTHQIDMHGNMSTLFGGDWCCGTAGETIIIERNTILYTGGFIPVPVLDGQRITEGQTWASGLAIKIRGNPADKAVVDGNIFKLQSREDAIAQNGNPGLGDTITNPIHVLPNNVFGSDPSTELGSCDFAGDGHQDQFMATGVTWWAKSPTTLQWRYLNTMKERLHEIKLGRVDSDAVCDVATLPPFSLSTPARYSKSGTGPWVLVPLTAK